MDLKFNFSKKEHSDSGLALILLTLIAGFWLQNNTAFKFAVAEVLVVLVVPVLMYPFTFLWLNISNLLGSVMSKVILIIIFYVFVFPVALFRKAKGIDTLKLKQFKKNTETVFIKRNHSYSKDDFVNPY
jgi:hypothetical protein